MLKKFFIFLLLMIVVVLISAYCLLFTKFGNDLIKPYIQEQITKHSPIPLELDTFMLRFNYFEVELVSKDLLSINANGNINLFTLSIDGVLNIFIENTKNVKELEGVNLENVLIENFIKGKITDLSIYTNSNIANGYLRIYTQILDFYLAKMDVDINNVSINSLLGIVNKPYVNGILNANASITGDSKMSLVGDANISIDKGSLQRNLIEKEFKIKIPATNFNINLNAKFDGKNINHNFDLISNIGNVESKGVTNISTLKTQSSYLVDIANLSPLTPFIGMPIYGSFRTNGKIMGNAMWLNIDGNSDVASSNTTYSVVVKEYSKPQDAIVTIKGLKLQDLLYMVGEPRYVNGVLNLEFDLKDISTNINGKYKHSIDGHINKDVVNNVFTMNIPHDIKLHNDAIASLTKGQGLIDFYIDSDIVTFNIKGAVLKLNEKSLKAPYSADIKDLKALKFLTSKELKGSISLKGDMLYNNGDIFANLNSNVFGGSLNGELNNNIFNLKLVNMRAPEVLDMLQYPKFFDAKMDGSINYDTLIKHGKLEFIVSKGTFTQNKLTNLLQKTLNFNVTREVFDDIRIEGVIDKSIITADLGMSSNNTSITTTGAKIDLDNDTINANLLLKVQKYELGGIVSGSISNPNIKLDTKKIGKDAVNSILQNQKVKDEIKKIENKVKDTIGKKLNNLLKK